MWKGKGEGLKFPVDLTQMKSTIMPVICVYEDVEIDSENLELIRSELINTEWWAYTLAKLILVIGAIAVVALVLMWLFRVIPSPNFTNGAYSDSAAKKRETYRGSVRA